MVSGHGSENPGDRAVDITFFLPDIEHIQRKIINIQRKIRTPGKKAKNIKMTNPPKLSRKMPQNIWREICQNVFLQVTLGADSYGVKKLATRPVG